MRLATLLSVSLLTLTGLGVAQRSPELVDEFESLSCSDIRYRSDNLMQSVAQDSSLVGVVVVSGRNEQERFHRRWLIENQTIYRQFDTSRIVFAKRLGGNTSQTQFWRVSKGSLPEGVDNKWSYMIPPASKPSILLTGGWDASECAPPSNEIYVSRFLDANPGSRSNVVIRCNGRRCFNNIRNEVRAAFSKARVPEHKLRYFYVPIRDEYYRIEYWILP